MKKPPGGGARRSGRRASGRGERRVELGGGRRERVVCDYIAGMTDRYALAAHRRHHAATPELRYGVR